MPNTVLMGAQWGDEGKGKIIDVLASDVDIVARFQGGNNAGHTVKIGDEKYVLHLIPSGILREDQCCVIGNGLVVNPIALLDEIAEVEKSGKSVKGRLFVSDRAHIVFPYHGAIDAAREARLSDGEKIGTTKRGIGPCYGDKVSRVGLRAGDLVDDEFPTLLKSRLDEANRVLVALGGEAIDEAALLEEYTAAAEKMKEYVADTVTMLNSAISKGESILFEGAQGTMLDIDFGSYPFVTSSNATSGGACTGSGVAPHRIDQVVGVIKAYTTRVGEGPFPTELFDEDGQEMGRVGSEFGATTGRPRRCGWFDAVVGRYSAMVNGVDFWAMTKLDVLDGFETLKICVAYECDGKRYDNMPASTRVLEKCTPIYEEMPGWMSRTDNVTAYDDLPEKAKAYVQRLCELTNTKLGILSVGPKRASTLRIAL
ncbi:MAG: adenylosuccinate synthase [Verrucomicrobia bacterium]|jgi:adenylosuccinate synthase|nr:adenylosuccinate synthase [Verrucomicrobiota bacterium]